MLLNDDYSNSVQFSIYLLDRLFDNDHNEYVEIKLHRYTNMDHPTDFNKSKTEFHDHDVPLKLCKENKDEWSLDLNVYCPDYKESDFLFGDYQTEKRSFLYLAIHYCDQDKLDKLDMNKTCKSREETAEYMKNTIVGLRLS